jgi:preprotein translocase subunit SecY
VSALGGGGAFGDKGLRMPLAETFRLAWADEELRPKIVFIIAMFAVFALGVNIPVPIPGVSSQDVVDRLGDIPMFQMLDMFGGGALRKVSILALGLNPYITASIIMQILTTAFPAWKKELQEGGEYARRQQNRRTRLLTLVLCVVQSWGFLQLIASRIPIAPFNLAVIIVFWTAGAMFMLWLGEQISEKGIGNGVSLMIFAGIMISFPNQIQQIGKGIQDGFIQWYQVVILAVIFLAVTWLIVLFTTAQRRIPIQHMRRMVGTRAMGGSTSYLPLTLNMAGVIPIIFAVSLVYMPSQFGAMFPQTSGIADTLNTVQEWLAPSLSFPKGLVGCLFYTFLIFFFTYFYTAVQYNVEDISNNLKRHGSFVPGVRPGKQTKDFLDDVISRITIVGACFLSVVALLQFLAQDITGIQGVGYFFGTSLLIMVSVALETMRQIEANLLMKQYGGP